MATLALYRKWRSRTFDEVIGQHHITQTLQNAIEANRVGHAYLFTGPRGTGKTSTARILAKAVNCTGKDGKPCNECSICQAVNEGRLMDLIEIDAASNTSVDDIRDLRDKVDFRPGEAEIKFYIIDEVHMLSKSAFNALLKTLEEPPPHVKFILATTEPEKIPASIMSRCQRFDFRRIKAEEVAAWLSHIVTQEGLKAEDDALVLIARQGGGSMRDSISLLDQLTSYGDEILSLDLVRSVLGSADNTATATLVDLLLAGDVGGGLKVINDVVNDGIEPRQFTLQVLEYLRGLLLVKYDNAAQFLNLPSEAIDAMHPQADAVSPAQLLKLIDRFNDAVQAFKSGAGEIAMPQLPLELAFVEAATTNANVQSTSQATSVVQEPDSASTFIPATAPSTTTIIEGRPDSVPVPPPPEPVPSMKPVAVNNDRESASGVSLGDIQRSMGAVGAELKKRNMGMIQGLLNSGQIISLQDKKIVMSFPSALLKERIEKYRETILEAFDEVLNTSMGIEFVVGQAVENIDNHTPSQEVNNNDAQKKTQYEDDPLIKSALDLGGKITGIHPMEDPP